MSDALIRALEQALRALVRQSPGILSDSERALPDGMAHTREAPQVTASGQINIVVINMPASNNTYVNTGQNTGVMGGGTLSGASGSATMTTNSSPAELVRLLKPFSDALGASGLSPARQNLLKSQLEVLDKEGAKEPQARDKNLISEALSDVQGMATTATALKGVWDTFGGPLTAWFGGGSS